MPFATDDWSYDSHTFPEKLTYEPTMVVVVLEIVVVEIVLVIVIVLVVLEIVIVVVEQ